MPPTTTGPVAGKATKPAKAATKPTTQPRLATMTVALGEVYNDSSRWNACCLPLLGCLLFGFAISLIVLGAVFDIEDLIIIGAMFVVGSLIFFFLLYLNVIRPMCKRNQVNYERYDSKTDVMYPVANIPLEDTLPDYGLYMEQNEDYLQAKNRPIPTESQLYSSSKSRSFLATPATATDVTFDEKMTPPPPRVKPELRRMASPPPKLAIPNENNTKKKIATFDMTIDENMRQRTFDETRDLELL